LNNYTPEEKQGLKNIYEEGAVVARGVVGRKVGEQGTRHLQGCVEFTERRTRAQVCRLFGNRCWCAVTRGSFEAAWNYCSKDNDILIAIGVRPMSAGEVTRERVADRAAQILRDCAELTVDEIIVKRPNEWLYHRSQLEKAMMEAAVERAVNYDGELRHKNYWVWGGTGTGKSMWAAKQALVWRTYRKGFNKWWDGFKPGIHEVVIVDDWPFDGENDWPTI
jgi:hypothetical protein